jgi:hypothetical protein
VLLAGLTASTTVADDGDSFLIPGVALRDADFTVGMWCRYLVVDEIMGERDSTTVRMAVTGTVPGENGESYWFEIESGPIGAPPRDRSTVVALISHKIKRLSPKDSIGHYVSNMYIKRGTDVPEPADAAELERLALADPASDPDWKLTPDVIVETADRRFSCDHRQLTVEDDREIPMGRFTLVKSDTDVYHVWLCDEVPVLRLVKCVIERVRNSRTRPAVPGIPDKENEQSRTTVDLIDYGTGATPTFEIP